MSLLSPSETLAFQSFLSSIDYTDSFPTPTEWLLYTQGSSEVSDPKAKDALKKATLDLMSLDTPSSTSSSWPNIPASDPAAASKSHFRYPLGRASGPEHPPPQQLQGTARLVSYSVDPASKLSGPSSSNTPSPISNNDPALPSDPSFISSSKTKTRSSSKRSFDKVSSAATVSSTSHKRIRSSPPPPTEPEPLRDSSSPPSSSVIAPPRPALLSASQKRANHIQSEQKRRANIRKGYEALCETIPTLREAIRKEEEEAAAGGSSRTGAPPASSSGKGRKKKSKAVTDDDKIDGRAGPKSENVVLQKTVDYIEELNSTREGLLYRLQQARRLLPPGSPALYPPGIPKDGVPLWEREWNGGLGSAGDEDEGMGSDEDAQ